MPTYVFAATDSSAADRAAATHLWNNDDVSQTVLDLFAAGNATFEFRPGTYPFEHSSNILRLGSNSVLKGSQVIAIPADKKALIVPDASKMAVFTSKRWATSCTMCDTTYHAVLETASGAVNIQIQDIMMAGYTLVRMPSLKQSHLTRVVVHNYRGEYPNGEWCNMGYNNANASFYLTGTCDGVVFDQCVSQFSFHHAYVIQSGGAHTWIRNITLNDCRALYSGCGQLRGDTPESVANSRAMVPERDGCGGRDWSCGFDINELSSSEHIYLNDCYAYSAWKSGFYQEPRKDAPEDTEFYDHVLTRCVSEASGQRNVRANGTTVCKESESSNFYGMAWTLVNCISKNAWKAGYYMNPEGMPQEAAKGVQYRVIMQGCVDCGSRYGLYMEMNLSGKILVENCTFANNTARAIRLYGGASPVIVRNVKIRTQLATKPPIKFGKMCRLFRHNSWDTGNQNSVSQATGFTVAMQGVEVSGTVEGLQAGTPFAEIMAGSSVNNDNQYPLQGVALSAATSPLDLAICGAAPPPSGGVDAAFSVTPSQGSAPLTVSFHDNSAGGPTEWAWSFGDGGASTQQHPTHTYTVPGVYPVTLTVRNASSSDTEPRLNAVTVNEGTSPPPPSGVTHFALLDLQVAPSVVRPGETVTISFRVTEA